MSPLPAVALALAFAARAAASDPPVVQVLEPQAVEVAPGGSALARVHVRVEAGYHVQANPVLDPALVPITLEVPAGGGLEAGPARYPAARRLRLAGGDEDLAVLDGRFAIELPVRARADAPAGRTYLGGTLRYQACDASRCLFPRSVAVRIGIRVRAP